MREIDPLWKPELTISVPTRNHILMSDILDAILERGDLAHLALFLWACVATAQAYLALRELGEATRRIDAFVRELARFNRRCGSDL